MHASFHIWFLVIHSLYLQYTHSISRLYIASIFLSLVCNDLNVSFGLVFRFKQSCVYVLDPVVHEYGSVHRGGHVLLKILSESPRESRH